MSSRLKQITTKAKELYKSGKYKKWTDAIKAASKTLTSTVKKSKVNGVNDVVWLFDVHKDKYTTSKKQIKVKASNRTSAYNRAKKRYPYPYFVELHSIEEKKIGLVKNKVVKKSAPKRKKVLKKSPGRSLHKDTKSHNVRISVMSGVKDSIKQIEDMHQRIAFQDGSLEALKNMLKYEKFNAKEKKGIIQNIKLVKLRIADYKKHLTSLKKHI
jgi:hypothetical protein